MTVPAPHASLGRPREAVDVHLPGTTVTAWAPGAVPEEVRARALRHREQLDAFLAARRSVRPAPEDAPRVIALVADAAARCGLEPSGAATGAIVQALGEELAAAFGEAEVEAPGLSFVASRRPRSIRLEAGGRALVIWLDAGEPVAVFTSATRVRPLPGDVDAIALVADACAVAEAAAISAAAMTRRSGDVARAIAYLRGVEGLRAGLVARGRAIGVFGGLRIGVA